MSISKCISQIESIQDTNFTELWAEFKPEQQQSSCLVMNSDTPTVMDPDLYRDATKCPCKYTLKLSSSDWMTCFLLSISLDNDTNFVPSSLLEPSPKSNSFLLKKGQMVPIQQSLEVNLAWPGNWRSSLHSHGR